MTADIIARVRARASNPETIHDMAQGLSPAPQIYPQATPGQIAATEADLGFPLPALLKQIFREIGNGGFGPGYGLIGVQGGYTGFAGGSLAEAYREFRKAGPDGRPRPWPEKVVPLCTWGCAIYSCLDCTKPEAPILVYRPDTHVLDGEGIIEVTLTDAEGNVVWTYTPPEEEQPPEAQDEAPQKEIPLQLHIGSFEEWIAAWADGMDLWEDMTC